MFFQGLGDLGFPKTFIFFIICNDVLEKIVKWFSVIYINQTKGYNKKGSVTFEVFTPLTSIPNVNKRGASPWSNS